MVFVYMLLDFMGLAGDAKIKRCHRISYYPIIYLSFACSNSLEFKELNSNVALLSLRAPADA